MTIFNRQVYNKKPLFQEASVLHKDRIRTNCPMQSGNSYFGGQSENSYFAQYHSGIALVQNGNLDRVRIFISRNCNIFGKLIWNTFLLFLLTSSIANHAF